MSQAFIPYPPPLPSPGPLPWVEHSSPNIDLWTYKVLRSCRLSQTQGDFLHVPNYRPFFSLTSGRLSPPLVLGAEHLFEWRDKRHSYPSCVILLSINPACQFRYPNVIESTHQVYSCPSYQITAKDCPLTLPFDIIDHLEAIDRLFDTGLEQFIRHLELFLINYHRPVTPLGPVPPILLSIPPSLPFPSQTDDASPLVTHQ